MKQLMNQLILFGVATTMLCCGNGLAQEQKAVDQKPNSTLILSDPGQDTRPLEYLFVDSLAFSDAISEYWIGIFSEPAEEFMIQVDGLGKIDATGGLRVTTVVDESPAKAAGLEKGDILYRVSDQKLETIGVLKDEISKTKTEPIELIIIRKGRPETITIRPERRPQPQQIKNQPKQRIPTYHRWVDADLGSSNRWFYSHDKPVSMTSLPKDFKAIVEFSNGTKPKVEIVKQDESWLVEDGKISKLPIEIQEFAANLLVKVTSIPNKKATHPETTYGIFEDRDNQLYRLAFRQFASSLAESTYLSNLDNGQTSDETEKSTAKNLQNQLNELQQQVANLTRLVEKLANN